MNLSEQQKKRFLQACPLFDGLQEDVITRVAARARGIVLPRGKTLFHQGDPSNGLYILCSGLVSICITDEEGQNLTLALPENGTPLGEMTMVSSDPRSATVTALEETSLLHVENATMVTLLAEEPGLATHLINFLSRRLRQSNETLHKFAYDKLQHRLLQKLTELGLQHGSLRGEVLDLGRKFSQNALAEMLGVTREAVNKQIRLLQEEGVVSIDDGIIKIRRPAEILKNLPTL